MTFKLLTKENNKSLCLYSNSNSFKRFYSVIAHKLNVQISVDLVVKIYTEREYTEYSNYLYLDIEFVYGIVESSLSVKSFSRN